jgi:WD40 repeat protein
MQKVYCLAILMLVLITRTFPVTGQEETIELVNTFGRGTVHQAVLSADGERVVVAGSRGLWVYDSEFNDLAHLETGAVQRLAWSSDDLYLAVVTQDSHLAIWNMTDYQLRAEVEFPEGQSLPRYEPITWKPNSHLLALAYPNEIVLWNADIGEFEDSLLMSAGTIKSDIAWNPDGTRLAVGAGSEVQIWDASSTEPLLQIELLDGEYSGTRPVYLAWSPDGSHIAAAEGSYRELYHTHNTLSIINATTGEITLVMQAGLTADVAWSADGTMIATATSQFGRRTVTPINVWDAQTGRLIAELTGHTREAHTVQWHPEGQQLLSAAYDNTARIWQVQPELTVNQLRENRVLRGHMDQVNVIAWTPDGSQLATGSEDGSIRVWDVASGEMIETDYQSDLWGVQALDYSPDGRYLAAGGGENWVRIWALTTDARIRRAQYEHGRHASPGVGNPMGITTVAWSPDSSTLASSGYDALVKLWSAEGDGDADTLRQGGWHPLTLHWFADGERLLFGTRGPEIWNVVAGEQLPLDCGGLSVIAVELSPDDRYLVVGDDMTGGYQLCDIDTGESRSRFGFYRMMEWNPVHSIAAGLRQDSTGQHIVLFDPLTFDVITGETIAEFTVNARVQTAVWSPDGRYLAIGLEDGTIQLWALGL